MEAVVKNKMERFPQNYNTFRFEGRLNSQHRVKSMAYGTTFNKFSSVFCLLLNILEILNLMNSECQKVPIHIN